MILQNNYLTVSITALGAELKSIVTNVGDELLWQADAKFWAKTSPVLFPIVGGLKDNYFEYNGEKYELSRHGFARDFMFDEEIVSKQKVVYTLKSNEDTLKMYPFHFIFKIVYELYEKQLKCTYVVENTSTKNMYFSVGAHPAFDLKGNMEHYELSFNDDVTLKCNTLNNGLISETVNEIPLEEKTLALKPELFFEDALVLKSLKSTKIILKNKETNRSLSFTFDNFPYFGIWAAKDAAFVCLEPWCGIADTEHHNHNLKQKEGINELTPSEIFKRSWQIAIV